HLRSLIVITKFRFDCPSKPFRCTFDAQPGLVCDVQLRQIIEAEHVRMRIAEQVESHQRRLRAGIAQFPPCAPDPELRADLCLITHHRPPSVNSGRDSATRSTAGVDGFADIVWVGPGSKRNELCRTPSLCPTFLKILFPP